LPDYQRCLDDAKLKHDGSGPDRSRADFTWCLIAIDWGWNIDATANRLIELSAKANEKAPDCARLTARNAATAADRRRRRSHEWNPAGAA
jgi:hypothetical protein